VLSYYYACGRYEFCTNRLFLNIVKLGCPKTFSPKKFGVEGSGLV